MEFENGDEEEILVEQILSDVGKWSGYSSSFLATSMAISHEIEDLYYPMRIITRWIDESE